MKKDVKDEEILKIRIMKRNAIIAFIFIATCSLLPFILTDAKIPLIGYIVIGGFLVIVLLSLIVGIRYREKIAQPKTKKILGYIVIICSALAFILNMIADILDKKINSSNFFLSIIGFVCFLIVGIILLKNSKKKE